MFTLPLYDVRLFSKRTNEDMQSQCLITSVHIIQSRCSKNRCLGLVALICCIKSCKQKTTEKNAVAFSQAESQRPAESKFTCEPFDCSVYRGKLLAHLRAVLSDKSLKPASRKKKVEGQPPEAMLRY